MQKLAKDIGKSETAFILYKNQEYNIRWFSPVKEMPICGHATMAAIKILSLIDSSNEYKLNYNNGIIKSKIDCNENISMIFPIDKCISVPIEKNILELLGINNAKEFIYGANTGKLVVIVDDEFDLLLVKPNFHLMRDYRGLYSNGIGVSKRSKIYDCETRYFNPWAGVDEDYVTGSVHTLLYSYWSNKLNKIYIKAMQSSQRPGVLLLNRAFKNTVEIKGKAVIVFKGQFYCNE